MSSVLWCYGVALLWACMPLPWRLAAPQTGQAWEHPQCCSASGGLRTAAGRLLGAYLCYVLLVCCEVDGQEVGWAQAWQLM